MSFIVSPTISYGLLAWSYVCEQHGGTPQGTYEGWEASGPAFCATEL